MYIKILSILFFILIIHFLMNNLYIIKKKKIKKHNKTLKNINKSVENSDIILNNIEEDLLKDLINLLLYYLE